MKAYQYPAKARVGQTIPKSTLYQQGGASQAVQQLFITQVESIHWAYKLSSATVHMQDQKDLKEIQIFSIQSRVPELDLSILNYVDKLIPSPIIFEIIYQGQVKLVASYKRLNQADSTKVVIGEYYASEWMDDADRIELPVYLNLADLYAHFIRRLLPGNELSRSISAQPHQIGDEQVGTYSYGLLNENRDGQAAESLEESLRKAEKIKSLQSQINRLKTKMHSERQFNHKVEVNRQIHLLETQLRELG